MISENTQIEVNAVVTNLFEAFGCGAGTVFIPTFYGEPDPEEFAQFLEIDWQTATIEQYLATSDIIHYLSDSSYSYMIPFWMRMMLVGLTEEKREALNIWMFSFNSGFINEQMKRSFGKLSTEKLKSFAGALELFLKISAAEAERDKDCEILTYIYCLSE